MYLAVFEIFPRHMRTCFVFVVLVVDPATKPTAVPEIPPQGSGIGVCVVVGEFDASTLLLIVVEANSETVLFELGVGQ